MSNDRTISVFDRTRGALEGVALFAKATTIKTVEVVTGQAHTFIVETGRHELKNGSEQFGDTIFIESISDEGVVRLALPPKVADVILR